MNDEFLTKLTEVARKARLNPSEKAQIGSKIADFVKANPLPAPSAPIKPFNLSKFFGSHFGALALASVLIVVGVGVYSVSKDSTSTSMPTITQPTTNPTAPPQVETANKTVPKPALPSSGKGQEYIYPPAFITPVANETATTSSASTTDDKSRDNSKATTASTTSRTSTRSSSSLLP